jgi:hypothetical protein
MVGFSTIISRIDDFLGVIQAYQRAANLDPHASPERSLLPDSRVIRGRIPGTNAPSPSTDVDLDIPN